MQVRASRKKPGKLARVRQPVRDSLKTTDSKTIGDREFYLTLREHEEHFNRLEFEVRKIASVWMLAIFSAIAFIVRGDLGPDATLATSIPLLCAIAFFGNIGLLTLWFLDQRVYHRLLNAAFTIGLDLERRDPGIPPLRWQMWAKSGKHGMSRFQALFYASPMSVNALQGIVAALRAPGDLTAFKLLLYTAALVAAALPVWVARNWLFGRSPRLRFLADPELAEQAALFNETDQVIGNWQNRKS